MGKVYLDEQILTDIADATRSKTGGSAALMPGQMADEIESIGQITPVPEKDVNFYDYDGTLLYSYTKQEFLALESLPANPTHDGLTAQGWNWSLQDAKTYVTTYQELDIGQFYITSDGKTRIYIELNENNINCTLSLAVNGTAEIDWGDNTSTSALTGSSTSTLVSTNHTYSIKGNYVISISITGSAKILGTYYEHSKLLGKLGWGIIKKVEIGENINLDSWAFYDCNALESISISNACTMRADAFSNCRSLKFLIITYNTNCTTNCFLKHYSSRVANNYAFIFQDCYLLKKATLGNSTASISQNQFLNCYSLSHIFIPSSVTEIKRYAFSGCQSLTFVDFSNSSAIPTLVNIDAFQDIEINYKIIVPDNLYDDWIVANVWSNLSSHIISKSD